MQPVMEGHSSSFAPTSQMDVAGRRSRVRAAGMRWWLHRRETHRWNAIQRHNFEELAWLASFLAARDPRAFDGRRRRTGAAMNAAVDTSIPACREARCGSASAGP